MATSIAIGALRCLNLYASSHESCWQFLAPNLLADVFDRVQQQPQSDFTVVATRQAAKVVTLVENTLVFDVDFESIYNSVDLLPV